ncbi:hypothetical protein [Motilimonas pumila]|uniref:Uncharacterized protein n=1 Tax=Motilimonas pumila TaxID=2303987 RepID=A0A418YGA6_9GAMM|nr:hypothetical protein [Motilimonas pumila]RJG48661.1 hypothetical protein D1Z90_07315 [Motilimonas pumila]
MNVGKISCFLGMLIFGTSMQVVAEGGLWAKCAIETATGSKQVAQFKVSDTEINEALLDRKGRELSQSGFVYAEDGKTKLKISTVFQCVTLEGDFTQVAALEIEQAYPE